MNSQVELFIQKIHKKFKINRDELDALWNDKSTTDYNKL